MKSFLSFLRKLDSSSETLHDCTSSHEQIQSFASLPKTPRTINKPIEKSIPGIGLSLYTCLLMIGTSIGIGIIFNPQRSWAGSTCVGTYSSRSGVTINASGVLVTSTTSSVIGYFNSITNAYVPLVNYTGGNNINAIATQPSSGNLFFVNRTTGKVVVFNVNTNVQTTLSGSIPVSMTAGSAIIGATFNVSGKLYIYYSDKKLIEVDPATGSQSGSTINISGIPGGAPASGISNNTTLTGGNTNGDIAIGTDGLIYILGDTSTTNNSNVLTYTSRLYTLTISGTTATATAVVASNITGLGGSAANGLAIDPATGKFYISSSLGTYELNTTTNSATQLTNATGTGDLAACGAPTPDLPTIAKAFNPNNVVGIPANSTLTLTLGNTNQVPIYLISTLVDNFQTGLTVRSPNNGLGGTCLADTANSNKVTTVAGSSSISLLNGLKVPAGGCTVTVNVTASNTGTFTNTIAAGALKTTAGNNLGGTTGILTVVPGDYGDAPITGTAPNGTGNNAYGQAIHGVIAGIQLGATIDSETISITNATASGDGADDDGLSSFPALTAGATSYSIPAANITATGTGTLHAWIDFNKNGTFDVGEYASVAVTNNTLAGNLNWTGITTGAAGNTFARFRFTSDATVTASTPSGIAADGEVEDYQVAIAATVVSNPNLLLVKRITAINGNTTNGTVSLNSYDPDPTYPYDKNVIQPGITPPTTDKWPNTIGNPLSSTFLLGARDGGVTKLGDEVEYTIYFLSAGTSTAQAVQLCDRIPNHQAFVPNSYNFLTPGSGVAPAVNADRGIALSYQGSLKSYTNLADGDIAQYYPPGQVPLPDVCKTVANPNVNSNPTGAVVVNLGLGATGTTGGEMPSANDPGSTNTSYGFVRFKVKNTTP
jgi:GEVED domain